MRVLVINCGSSSLKVELLSLDEAADASVERLARGSVSGIGHRATLELEQGGQSPVRTALESPSHEAAVRAAIDSLAQAGVLTADPPNGLDAVAHRIVHGGPRRTEPIIIDEAVMRDITAAAELAPLHNDAALSAIRAVRRLVSATVPMVAVFDTAFHAAMPERAWRYAIPRDAADALGIRRYGFHGLAHRSMAERCAERMGRPPASLKLITLQLGSGCSAAAIAGGRSIDTSMGFSPLEGLMMGTRSGDIDPAIVRFLCEQQGMSVREAEQWLNGQAGLLGVSGASADVRELLKLESSGHRHAALALEMFCYRVRKYIGADLAALGGTDALVFGGGVGENSAEIRRRICAGLEWCGLAIDAARNDLSPGAEGEISADGAGVKVFVIKVDEAVLIARDAAACVHSRRGAAS